MTVFFSLFTSPPDLDLPRGVLSWLGWLSLLGMLIWAAWRCREKDRTWTPLQWLIMTALILVVPLTSLFFGIRLPAEPLPSTPGLPFDPTGTTLMVLSALPWVVAAGLLGTVAALGVAVFSGMLLSLWDSHHLFTILEIAGLAILFSACIRQRYRTLLYRVVRHPAGAALLLALGYAPLYILSGFAATPATLAVRMDYALTQSWQVMVARGGALIFAGLLAEALYLFRLPMWGCKGPLLPSPAESNLQLRFLYRTAPLAAILVLVMAISGWVVAGKVAKTMVRDRLSSIALVAAESLPHFMETGQSLIMNLADSDLLDIPPHQLQRELGERMRVVPYYRQLSLFDAQGGFVAGYPITRLEELHLAPQELTGIHLALQGVLFQNYTLDAWPGDGSAQISFLAAVADESGQITGVLVGRTDLSSNPFTQPAIQALETMQEVGGEGMILDENRQIIYHTQSALVMNEYVGAVPEQDEFFADASSAATRRLVYYRPTVGRPWSVVLAVPAEYAQQLALTNAVPLMILLPLLVLLAFMSLRLGLQTVTSSLHRLAKEATLISQGDLDHPLQVEGIDEVGSFGKAFEQMRLSLKARLEELSHLLQVSQGVASHLELQDAILPVLQAALGDEASLARIVLVSEALGESQNEAPLVYGRGSAAETWSYLDGQIIDLVRQQGTLVIPNTQRMQQLIIPHGALQPGAVLAVGIYHESTYYGVLWVGYDEAHAFTETEIQFMTTLAGQAALAATNARLYTTAEVGRRRLEAVLASTPEPVMVIDERMCIFLLNPAAMQVHGLIGSVVAGQPVQEVILHADLLELIVMAGDEKQSRREIAMPDGRIYSASVSPVVAEGRSAGKICILRDITHYKELDTLKTEFVATVSHDLRSPLTLMRGYATMLDMVGDLNEQQKSYVNKIVSGVEGMSGLVGNLLDLGRIEAGIGLQIESVDVMEVIQKVLDALLPQASQKKIQLEKQGVIAYPEGQPLVIQADPALLEQALYNLVENAVKYSTTGGVVCVGCEASKGSVVITVRDNGIGIAPVDLPHMFEKFYRSGGREAHKQRGMGLGLAIVKSIVERHGGKVSVQSSLGKGSTFYIEIPLEQDRDSGRKVV